MYPGLCKENGKKPYSPICIGFAPDYTALQTVETTTLKTLATVLAKCTAQQTRILSHLLMRKQQFDTAGYRFGQPIFFCIGELYLSNVVCGYLLSVDKKHDGMVLVSDMEALQRKQAIVRLIGDKVWTEEQFYKLRTKLIREDKVIAPFQRNVPNVLDQLKMTKAQLAEYHETLQTKPNDYAPPTIDSVPSSWLDRRVLKSLVNSRTDKSRVKVKKGKSQIKIKIAR